ncbi:hypothetical protein H0H93_012439, partial [Arthromyces matolae]
MAFDAAGSIPLVEDIDPAATSPDIDIDQLAQRLRQTDWENLSVEERRFKGFFTQQAMKLFFGAESDLYHSDSTIRAQQLRLREATLPSIVYSPQQHKSLHEFIDAWRPSLTGLSECAWICVLNPRIQTARTMTADIAGLQSAWKGSCAQGRATADELFHLARQFGVLTGKWILLVTPDEVDRKWYQIAHATHAGTLGTQARVSPVDESNGPGTHRIYVYTKDFTDTRDIHR